MDPVPFEHLPEKFRLFSVWATLDNALSGPRYGLPSDRASRYPNVVVAARRVVDGIIDPAAYSETKGNPNSETVRALFKNAGIPDVFRVTRPAFDAAWSKPESSTFVSDKLDEIVARRHRVAHSADALSIVRGDLSEATRFLHALGGCLDTAMEAHVKSLVARGKRAASRAAKAGV